MFLVELEQAPTVPTYYYRVDDSLGRKFGRVLETPKMAERLITGGHERT